MDLCFISNQVVTSPRTSFLTSLGIMLGSLAHLIKASKSIAFASVRPPLQPPSLVFGLLAVYQNSAIYIRVCGSQDGYCSSTLPANLASVFSTCLFVLLFGLGGCFASHASVAVKSAQRLPLSLLTALPFNIACKRILLSDPARAVLHSARSAGEISEFFWSRHPRKSHRLT